MHRFKKVGIVLDLEQPNEFTLDHAQALVEINNATIHVICPSREALSVAQRQAIEGHIKRKVDFEFTIVYLVGKPVIEIAHYSDREALDILLIEPDSAAAIERFFYGSLVLALMRRALCPVWVVKQPVAKQTYQRILIAVDPAEETTDPKLNDKLIEIGTSYARQQSAECYLVTAWRLPGESMLAGPFINTPPDEIEKLRVERHIECARAFEALEQRHAKILQNCQTQMIYGEPGYAIPKFVKDKNINLVVMGTLGRAGVRGFFIGNTAETIINQIDCSIMAIKPDGFANQVGTDWVSEHDKSDQQ